MSLDTVSERAVPVGVTPPSQPLGMWAAYRAARRNVLELIPEAAYREPILAGAGKANWIMVMDPPAIEHILKTREADYPKSAVLIRLMTPREGRNLIISEGEDWKRQRRGMSPVFQPRALDDNAPMMTRAAETTVARLEPRAGGVADVFPEMVTATCDVICDLALSGRDSIDRPALTGAVNKYVETIGRISILDILGAPNWIPRPSTLLDRSRARMDRMTDTIIADRIDRGPSDPPDMLDLLIEGHRADPETSDLVEVRNNLLGFLFAGHETTALSLTWALYLLALDQRVQDEARDTVRAAIGRDAATADDLDNLTIVRRIIDEAMRLYPPAGFLTRTARRDDRIGDTEIRAGATVILPIYALHRHERLWDRPDRFDPSRFETEAARARHRFAYLPFGAGPRICIGASLALMEAQIILATLLARFRFTLPDGFVPDPRMWFTLRPGTGMPLAVEAV